MTWKVLPNRAKTVNQKIEVISRLVVLWSEHPTMRLTQLIANYYRIDNDVDRARFYNLEDYDFIEGLERFYRVSSTT